jgi:regulatory protein
MIVTAIKQQVKRAGKYAFSLSEAGLLESKLVSGQELTAAELKKHKKAAGLDKAYGNALRYAAMRPHSEWEMAQYFRRKGIDEAAATHITARLRDLDLLSDLAFARSWVANRRLLKPVSKRRLVLELRQKHVSSEVIDQVLAEDETDEREALRQLIQKKRTRYPDTQKLLQYLARQGFNYDDIQSVLRDTDPE